LQLETKHSTRRRCVSSGSTTTPTTDVPNESDVMTLMDAATFLKCCPTTIKRRAKILHIPHKRLGSLWRFYRPDLEAWMREYAA
jgi:excisionase family DNA binding protein